jgi:hypothetical protein
MAMPVMGTPAREGKRREPEPLVLLNDLDGLPLSGRLKQFRQALLGFVDGYRAGELRH